MKKLKIKFEVFKNVFELLPSIYYYKQSFREKFGKGVIVLGWLRWGVVIYYNTKK